MKVSTIPIDFAQNVFQFMGFTPTGKRFSTAVKLNSTYSLYANATAMACCHRGMLFFSLLGKSI
ncbi:MAG: hypothetical protein GY787_31515 [Alteromonadales bacterium]|nr:hypothetical protein [Alteromonadales bacterium]